MTEEAPPEQKTVTKDPEPRPSSNPTIRPWDELWEAACNHMELAQSSLRSGKVPAPTAQAVVAVLVYETFRQGIAYQMSESQIFAVYASVGIGESLAKEYRAWGSYFRRTRAHGYARVLQSISSGNLPDLRRILSRRVLATMGYLPAVNLIRPPKRGDLPPTADNGWFARALRLEAVARELHGWTSDPPTFGPDQGAERQKYTESLRAALRELELVVAQLRVEVGRVDPSYDS